MTEVKVVADSINPEGQRILTMTWKYPRYIHSEIMTHRMLVKNAASSRAIPIKRMLDMVISDPVIPIRWGKNQAGMQSMEWLEDRASDTATLAWLEARTQMVRMCNEFDKLQIHKQWANRVLEPWMHITVLVTGTEWGNFFNLRAHPDAHPDFQALAYRVLEMHEESKPKELNWGQWHLPFGDQMPEGIDNVTAQLRVATARAARLSYLTFDGVIDPTKDFDLHDSLLRNGHFSPTEHSARAEKDKPDYWAELQELLRRAKGYTSTDSEILSSWLAEDLWRDQGCFRGWTPYRKLIPGENQREFDVSELLARKPEWLRNAEVK